MSTNFPHETGERFLRPKEVQHVTSLSRTSLWRASRRGELVPVRLSPGRVGYAESAVRAWVASKLQAA